MEVSPLDLKRAQVADLAVVLAALLPGDCSFEKFDKRFGQLEAVHLLLRYASLADRPHRNDLQGKEWLGELDDLPHWVDLHVRRGDLALFLEGVLRVLEPVAR